MDKLVPVNVKQLEKLELHIKKYIDKDFLGCKVFIDETLPEKIGLEVSGFIWGEKGGKVIVSYPKDWWQMLKKQYAPKWFVKRFPVIENKEEIKKYILRPDVRLEHEEKTMKLLETQMSKDKNWFDSWCEDNTIR